MSEDKQKCKTFFVSKCVATSDLNVLLCFAMPCCDKLKSIEKKTLEINKGTMAPRGGVLIECDVSTENIVILSSVTGQDEFVFYNL